MSRLRVLSRFRSLLQSRRPLALVLGLASAALLTLAIIDGNGANAFTAIVTLIGAVIDWFRPRGKQSHPANESTIQWIRKRRREHPAGTRGNSIGDRSV
jgi:hypothetical protein